MLRIIINPLTALLASLAIYAAVIMAVWHIFDDRSTDIAVPDDSAIARHDPNPPMKIWPRIPGSVGTNAIGR